VNTTVSILSRTAGSVQKFIILLNTNGVFLCLNIKVIFVSLVLICYR